MSTAEASESVSILIAEDSRMQAKVLENKLTEAGYQVRVAEDGALALEMIREQRPTLVISDIEMPQMNGYEFCSAVKGDPDLKTIPFILLSTLSEPEDIIRGLHSGADNYVTKPYDPEFLIGRVESLLATPLGSDEDSQQLEVTLAGTHYKVSSGRQQVLNLLVSTFENAVEKNKELLRTNEQLTIAKDKLTISNQQLGAANEQLASANTRMSQDLDAAARVQQSLLPNADPESSRVDFSWKYLPCDELAGDFLNFFRLDDRHIAAFVVDVSGHGVASSLLSVTIGRFLTPQVSASSLLLRGGSQAPQIVAPSEVMDELNRRFPMDQQNGLYFTMAYGVLDIETLEFRYVLAGHPPPILYRKGQPVRELPGTNFPVGIVDEVEYADETIQMEPGDRLYLYSDGIPEAMDPQRVQFEEQRLLETIEVSKSMSLEDSIALVLETVERWAAPTGLTDDVSLLGLEIAPAGK